MPPPDAEAAAHLGERDTASIRAGRLTHTRTTDDHMILTMSGKLSLVVPGYDDLPPFILRGLIRTAGLTVDEFIGLLG